MNDRPRQSRAAALYTPQILALAVELSRFPMVADLQHCGEARSRTCGSQLQFGCDLRADGAIGRIGLQVTACAIGQAAAAIFASDAAGRSMRDIQTAHDAIASWLIGEGAVPRWSRMDVLVPAVAHRARHGAILLPWKAALAALSNPATAR